MSLRKAFYSHRIFCCRNKSTNFRYVESDPPLELKTFNCRAPSFFPQVNINIDNSAVDEEKCIKKDSNLHTCSRLGDLKVESIYVCDDQIKQIFQNDVCFDDTYRRLTNGFDYMFIQYTRAIHEINNLQDNVKFINGDRRTGKTMAAFFELVKATESQRRVVLPLLHLAKWFQDTSSTQLTRHEGDVLDFPNVNQQFLEFFSKCNASNRACSNVRLLDDERWSSGIYSFKGDHILDVAKLGIENPLVSHLVISRILDTLAASSIPTATIIDNINLLSEIHASKLESHRDLEAVEWWDQPPVSPDNIPLLRDVKSYLRTNQVDDNTLTATVDARNPILEQVTSDLELRSYDEVSLPPTLSPHGYSQYLKFLRRHDFISTDMDENALYEFAMNTGMNFIDTYRLSVLL